MALLHLCTFSMLTGQWLMVVEFLLSWKENCDIIFMEGYMSAIMYFLNIIDFRNFYINIAISFKAHSSTACKRSIL